MKHSNRIRSCNIAFTRHGKCARAGPRAKLNGKDHPQFLGEGDETFMEDSGKNAILQDLTPYFCVTPYFCDPIFLFFDPIFFFTTNAIESFNFSLRKLIMTRGAFPTDEAAIKLLYPGLRNIARRWTMLIHKWKQAMRRLMIRFGKAFNPA